MTSYAALDTSQQVAVLRRVAVEAAQRFGLDAVAMDLVLHAFNTTFGVDVRDGRRFALRVNTNSLSTPDHVVAEQAWVHAVSVDTGLLVPDPLTAPDGSHFVLVPCPELGRELIVVVNSWLDGPDAGELTPELGRQLGRAMATLHDHSTTWTIPPGGQLTTFDSPLFGDPDCLASWPMAASDRRVIDAALARCSSAFATVYQGRTTQALHADLHGGNLKWHAGRLAIFDFDDCGLGVPEVDLAVAAFYLRKPGDQAEAALLAGYAEVRALPQVASEVMEALIAARQLLLFNSLLLSVTAEFRSEIEDYQPKTVARLRHWLEQGRFLLTPDSSS